MNKTIGVLGIDTSAYTTSVAWMSTTGRLVHEERRLLSVPNGQRGLRQSQAFFQHCQALPLLCSRGFNKNPAQLAGVCVSCKPRPQPDSYMPVFLAGTGFGTTIAAALQVPYMETSHQEGHFWAAIWSLTPAVAHKLAGVSTVLFLHASGGTTELIHIDGLGKEHTQQPAFAKVAGTSDISAGQFVDRVGVALGLPFPAGRHLEALASEGTLGAVQLPVAVAGSTLSFSGPDSAARRCIDAGARPADVGIAVYVALSRALAVWINAVATSTGSRQVLLSGGVLSSSLLRQMIRCEPTLGNIQLLTAHTDYCGDNAVGVAALGVAQLTGVPILAFPERND